MAMLDNLISYWKMDESSGNALDAHASHDLTDTNTVGSGTGIISNARDFERGNSEYVGITDHADFSFGNEDFSISLWVKLETAIPPDPAMCFIGKTTSTVSANSGDEYALGLSHYGGGSLSWTVRSSSAMTQKFWGSTLTTATWYHIVVWHDATANVIGINVDDGTALTAAHTTGCQDGTNNFLIGAIHGGGDYMDGLVDEVGIWNKVLTSGEITDLYNSGSGLAYPFGEGGVLGTGLLKSKLLRRLRLVS